MLRSFSRFANIPPINRSCNSNVHNATRASCNDSEDSSKDDLQSKIYLRNVFGNNKIYILKFKTTEVSMQPLFLKERIFEDRVTDKCVQPRSTEKFVKKYNLRSKRLCILYKSFQIDKKSNRLSIMSNKKPLFKPRNLEPLPVKQKKSISTKVSSVEQSIIYFTDKGVHWELYPGIIDLNLIKPIDQKTQEMIQNLIKNIGMESTELTKNTATFVVKHKKDVFKVRFRLVDILFDIVFETISESSQVVDEHAYFQAFSVVTDRSVYIPIPKTTYEYIDPMVDVRRRNSATKFGKMEPRWVSETRKKRLNEYRRCRVVNPYINIQELKIGSSLCYEVNNCIYKAKTGTIECGVDDRDYEDWACSYQKINYSNLEDDTKENDQFPAMLSGTIPDWDLVLNNI